MPREEDDAIATLGGFGLEDVLTDLDADAVSGLRTQLGLGNSNIGYGRDDLYNGKFADDEDGDDLSRVYGPESGKDWEEEADREVRIEMEREGRESLVRGGKVGRVRGEVDDYDEDEEEDASMSPLVKGEQMDDEDMQDLYAASPPKPDVPKEADVYDLYPTFEPHSVLQFTDLFATLPRKRQKVEGGYVRINYPPTLPKAPSTVAYLNGTRPFPPSSSRLDKLPKMLEQARAQLRAEEGASLHGAGNSAWEALGDTDQELSRLAKEHGERGGSTWRMPKDQNAWEALAMGDWEDEIIWNPACAGRAGEAVGKALSNETRLARPRNPEVEQGDWTKSIIWDAQRKPWKDFTALVLTEDDPEMLLQLKHTEEEHEEGPDARTRARAHQVDPFNLSNDRLYEASKEHRRRIRQTFGNLEVQHSHIANKLQLPLYKTRLSKTDARSFHRPALQFPVNMPITFSKVKAAKKKKDKLGRKIRNTADASELLKSTQDLTLKDTGGFVLVEYSEEAPPIISNIGMGSILVNYYRKKDAKDTFVPQDDLGEPFVLDVADESPFMKFGSIKSGQTVPALYNNLIRAPLFKHKADNTDFLVIRTTIDNEVNYYLRPIDNLYVIGQTYPVVEVPGPHSRKITTQMKNRLQSIAFKLCEMTSKNRIKVTRLMKYFPEQTELQMRQRLKEFMEYSRKGPNQGFWMVKSSIRIPDREETQKLVSPEGICLSESMQVGQRALLDAGYGKDADAENEGDDDSTLDIEQQLAPWAITKNFIQATQNKAMLKLHGEGDPSGRGEAFSFMRVSMKDVFLREGETIEDRNAEIAARPKSSHRYNVNEQQDIYKQEVERIWQAQLSALSNPHPPDLSVEDEIRARERNRGGSVMPETPWSAGAPTPGDWSRRGSRSPSAFSRHSTPERDDGGSTAGGRVGANKAVKIRRLVDGKWHTEVVRDTTIVNAYLRQRRLIEDQEPPEEALLPTNDPEKNERRKKLIEEQLAKLKKNQERRLARKQAKEGGLPMPRRGAGKNDTTRKCGNCGMVGHMKTNRKCPKWAEFNDPNSAPAPVAGPSIAPGAVGIAGLGVFGGGGNAEQ